MFKLLTVTWVFVLIISDIGTNIVQASNRLFIPMEAQGLEPWKYVTIVPVMRTNVQASNTLSVPIGAQNLQPSKYVTITGCNNDCDTACCNCDIQRQPPICIYCCQEET